MMKASRLKHKDREIAYRKEYRRKNKDKIAEKNRRHRVERAEWYRTWNSEYAKTEKGKAVLRGACHRRRQKVRAGTATADQLLAIKANAKGRCHYCGRKSSKLTFDHITPLSKGGLHSADNIVMACFSCNRAKSDHDPVEFAKTKGLLLI